LNGGIEMKLMSIKESVNVFLTKNKDALQKIFTESQIRAFYNIFESYSTFFEEGNFYLTPIEILKMRDDVDEQVQQRATQSDKQPNISKENVSIQDEDEDIKNLFEA
jgi:hypothetical protein